MDRVRVAVAVDVPEVVCELDLAQEAEPVRVRGLLLFMHELAVLSSSTEFVSQLFERFFVFGLDQSFAL